MTGAPILEFSDVTCSPDDGQALNGVTFTVGCGDNVIVFGPERAGMALLTQCILAVRDDYRGEIRYRGDLLGGLDYAGRMEYRYRIGYLHGDYGLLSNMTVEQNISLPLEYHSDLPEGEVCGIVDSLINELKLDGCRAKRPISLTASEILRTAYARAVVKDPELLVVEHAISSQSPLNIRSFMETLHGWADRPEKTLFMVTYEPQRFADLADRYIMLYRGAVVFQGSREDFQNSGNPYLVQYRSNSPDGPMEID